MSAVFPYLTAVIHETLRIFPPVPIGMPRITPKGGGMVAGVWVPGGVGAISFLPISGCGLGRWMLTMTDYGRRPHVGFNTQPEKLQRS
jgi:hypothetical protein